MDQSVAVLVMHQGLLRQPVQQFIPIRCFENFVEGIRTTGLSHPCGDRQQVQVVVAQHHDQVVAAFYRGSAGHSGIWGRG